MITIEELKKIYEKIEKEKLQDYNIDSFDDFLEYVKNTILNNIEYDFNIML